VNNWQAVSLAAVLCGMPVIDAQGALLGLVESVRTDDLNASAGSGLIVRACGVREFDFFVAAARIACVADDHVRLSVTAEETIAAPRSNPDPR
jgi:hypothetical protein